MLTQGLPIFRKNLQARSCLHDAQFGGCSFPGKVQWKEPSWAKIVREEVSQAKDWTSHLSDCESGSPLLAGRHRCTASCLRPCLVTQHAWQHVSIMQVETAANCCQACMKRPATAQNQDARMCRTVQKQQSCQHV